VLVRCRSRPVEMPMALPNSKIEELLVLRTPRVGKFLSLRLLSPGAAILVSLVVFVIKLFADELLAVLLVLVVRLRLALRRSRSASPEDNMVLLVRGWSLLPPLAELEEGRAEALWALLGRSRRCELLRRPEDPLIRSREDDTPSLRMLVPLAEPSSIKSLAEETFLLLRV